MPTYYHGWIRKAEVEQLLKQVNWSNRPTVKFCRKSSLNIILWSTKTQNSLKPVSYQCLVSLKSKRLVHSLRDLSKHTTAR